MISWGPYYCWCYFPLDSRLYWFLSPPSWRAFLIFLFPASYQLYLICTSHTHTPLHYGLLILSCFSGYFVLCISIWRLVADNHRWERKNMRHLFFGSESPHSTQCFLGLPKKPTDLMVLFFLIAGECCNIFHKGFSTTLVEYDIRLLGNMPKSSRFGPCERLGFCCCVCFGLLVLGFSILISRIAAQICIPTNSEWAGANQKVFFIKSSFLGTRKHYAVCQGNEAVGSPTQGNTYEPKHWPAWEEVCKKCSKWHPCVSGNQQLFNWTKGLLGRKTVPGTRNLVHFLKPVRPWTSEKDLLPWFCYTSISP